MEIVMKIEGIIGQSTAHDHSDWIEIVSVYSGWDHAADQARRGPRAKEVTVVKPVDAASTSLRRHLIDGDYLDYVLIDWLEGVLGQRTVKQLTLTNAFVSHMGLRKRQKGERASYEEVGFGFSAQEVQGQDR